MGYIFDTSALVDAWTKWYSMSSIPRFWQNLEQLAVSSQALIPDAVLLELQPVDDELYRWCKTRESTLVAPTSQPVQELVAEISNGFPNLRHVGPPGANFADPVVIALAIHMQFGVVTHEQATGNLHGPRIPDVCKARGVRVMQVHHVVLERGWTFG